MRNVLQTAVVAAVLVGGAGCGDGGPRLDSPEARYTEKNAEVLLQRGFPGEPLADDRPPGKTERVECSGGENAGPRGDFRCTAFTDAEVRIECEGFVTNGKVASGGCSPPRRTAP